jgi:XRE family transcriptional regulator, master regulator for biofilm formation
MIGKEIKKIRQNKGYSISKLAKMADVSKSYLSQIEKGKQTNPSLQLLKKISISLETSLESLLEDNKQNTNVDLELDEEWIALLTDAINEGMEKEDFQDCLSFIQYKRWLKKQNKK